MGIQNAIVRAMAIPDVTTTILTMTVTGIAADSKFAGGTNPRLRRRVSAVLIMFLGALLEASLVLHFGVGLALAGAAAILIVVSGFAWRYVNRAP